MVVSFGCRTPAALLGSFRAPPPPPVATLQPRGVELLQGHGKIPEEEEGGAFHLGPDCVATTGCVLGLRTTRRNSPRLVRKRVKGRCCGSVLGVVMKISNSPGGSIASVKRLSPLKDRRRGASPDRALRSKIPAA